GALKGERLAVLEAVPAVEAKARHAAHRELDHQDVARLAAWIVGRRPVHRADRAVGKGPGVKARGLFRVMVVPQADRVFLHRYSPLFAAEQGKVRALRIGALDDALFPLLTT